MKKAGSQYISHQTKQSDFVRPFRLNNRFHLRLDYRKYPRS
jgi:hypothetical protein